MVTTLPHRFPHSAFPKGIDVWPKVHENTLNYKLDTAHYHAKWDNMGATNPDPYAGFFPTTESVEARNRGDAPRDGLGNVRKGMTAHVKVITLAPGKIIFRFAQGSEDNKVRLLSVPETEAAGRNWGPFCGAWWTSALGFENMLARVSATYENSSHGVVGGQRMTLRQYARRYSAVFTDWNHMEFIGMSRVLRPIKCFMGMGAPMPERQVKVNVNGISLLENESYGDTNVQLYIPNLFGQIGTFLSYPQVWSPEVVDEKLSRHIQNMRRVGAPLHARKNLIYEALTGL